MSENKLDVKKAVMVIGVKGGIGKSIISSVVSIKLKELMPVILVDADVASPNLPDILKVSDKITEIGVNKKNVILIEDNLDFFSMGLIAGDNLISMKSMQYINLLSDIICYSRFNVPKNESCLLIDCPASIDDIHRGLVELLAEVLCGAIIVTTPSSFSDCKRAIQFCKKFGVPILALVENMAYFKCSKCGEKYYVFGEPKAKKLAQENKIDYYQVPVLNELHECIEIGMIDIPEELDYVSKCIAEKIYKSEPAKESIFTKLRSKVRKMFREQVAKAIGYALKKINTDFDLKEWIDKGYGNSSVEVILESEGKRILNLCFKIDKNDAKVKVVRMLENPDITLIVDINKAMEIIEESKRLGKLPKELVKQAVLSGDVVVIGDQAMLKSIEFIENVYPVIAEELYNKLSPGVFKFL